MPTARSLVLVVDGHPGIRKLAQRLLERGQYQVVLADGMRSAADALDVHGNDIAVLLTELRLVDGDGISLGAHAARRNPGIRVIYMASLVDSNEERIAIHLSGTPLIRKPFTVERLVSAVCTALELCVAG